MYVTAIIAAAGRGERFGAGQPKQLSSIGGQTILERSVNAFLDHDNVDDLEVRWPSGRVQHVRGLNADVAYHLREGDPDPRRLKTSGDSAK